MIICKNCEQLFDEDEFRSIDVSQWIDDRRYEEYEHVCPYCGSDDYSEAVECKSCGEYVPEECAYNGYCEDCVEKAATPENLIEWCDDEDFKEKVEINEELLAMCKFLNIDIEAVLKAAINESVYKDKLNAYCKMTAKEEIDTEHFMKWVEKKRG